VTLPLTCGGLLPLGGLLRLDRCNHLDRSTCYGHCPQRGNVDRHALCRVLQMLQHFNADTLATLHQVS
jgi:hypothetical protein